MQGMFWARPLVLVQNATFRIALQARAMALNVENNWMCNNCYSGGERAGQPCGQPLTLEHIDTCAVGSARNRTHDLVADAVHDFARKSGLHSERERLVPWLAGPLASKKKELAIDVCVLGGFPTRYQYIDVTIRAACSASRYQSVAQADRIAVREKVSTYTNAVTTMGFTTQGRFMQSAQDAVDALVQVAQESTGRPAISLQRQLVNALNHACIVGQIDTTLKCLGSNHTFTTSATGWNYLEHNRDEPVALPVFGAQAEAEDAG